MFIGCMEISKVDLLHIWSYKNFVRDEHLQYKKNKNDAILKIYPFKKLNIIYGENWSWKSTFVRLMRLLNGDKSVKEKLQPRWSSEPIDYRVYDKSGEITYEKYKWKILTFDKKYIKDHVGDFIYESDSSTDQNKQRWEHILVVWDFVATEKSLQQEEAKHKEAKEENEKTFKNIEEQKVLTATWVSITREEIKQIYEEHIKSPYKKKEVENEIQQLQQEKEQVKMIKEKSTKITAMSPYLEKISKIKSINNTCRQSFQQTLHDAPIFEYGEKQHISGLIKLTKDNNLSDCLLCQQPIKSSQWDFIERIQKLMIERVDTISSYIEQIRSTITEISDIPNTVARALSENKQTYEYYNEFTKENWKKYPDRNLALSDDDKNIISQVEKKCKDKVNKLSEKFDILDLNSKFDDIIKEVNNYIEVYNSQLSEIEKDIKKLKDKVTCPGNILEIEKKITFQECVLLVIKKENYIKEIIKKEFDSSKESSRLEEESKSTQAKKNSIKDAFSQFAQKRGQIINMLVQEINPSLFDKIDFDFSWTYSKWSCRCWFIILHSPSQIKITHHLSEWEKRSIAFAYFLSDFYEISNDELKLKNWYWEWKIAVFDDPTTEYDKNNKFTIAEYLVTLANWFDQTFILTHDERLKSYISKRREVIAPRLSDAKFTIAKNHFGFLYIVSTEKDQLSLFQDKMKSIFTDNIPDYICIPSALRYCIEYLIRDELMWREDWSVWSIIKNKLGKKWIDKLKKSHDKLKELSSLYTYCNGNGAHYSETDGHVSLQKEVRNYFELCDYICGTNHLHDIENDT